MITTRIPNQGNTFFDYNILSDEIEQLPEIENARNPVKLKKLNINRKTDNTLLAI